MNSTIATASAPTTPAPLELTQPATRDRRAVVVTETIQIARPAAAVWTAIADYSFDLQWRVGITEMTPVPAGAPRDGTHVHEVLRSSGMTFTTDAVVSDVVPGVGYRFAGRGTIGLVQGMRMVVPTSPTSASFTYQVEMRPTGKYIVLRAMLRSVLASGLRKDLSHCAARLAARRPTSFIATRISPTRFVARRSPERAALKLGRSPAPCSASVGHMTAPIESGR